MQVGIDAARDAREEGWLKQEAAAYMHFYDPQGSQELLISANEENPAALRPLAGVRYRKLLAATESQSATSAQNLRNLHDDVSSAIISVNNVLGNLWMPNNDVEAFESALARLAPFLGFVGQRPEQETGGGPDVIWALGNLQFLVFECKSRATTDRVSKRHIDQLSGWKNWFNDRYDSSCTSHLILVHHTSRLGPGAHPHPDARVMTTDGLERLRSSILGFFESIGRESDPFDPKVIGRHLTDSKLRAEDFPNRYAMKFEAR
jgi:hypothetical protein